MELTTEIEEAPAGERGQSLGEWVSRLIDRSVKMEDVTADTMSEREAAPESQDHRGSLRDVTAELARDCGYAVSILGLSWLVWTGLLDARRGQELRAISLTAGLSGRPLAMCALVLLPAGLALILRLRRWPSPGLRIAAMAAAAPLAWYFSTYAANPALGESHMADRLLVLVLAGFIWLHPAAIGAFLAVIGSVGAQFTYPIGGYTWTDKHLPVSLLALLLAGALLSPLAPKRGHVIAICAGGVAASPYVVSGLAKIPMSWHENDLGNLFASSYVNGWLADLGESTVVDIANVLSFVSPALVLLTLIVEVGAIAVVVTRRAATPVIVALLALHAMIYLSSGILFWKWGAALLGLAVLLRSRETQSVWSIGVRRRVALGLLAVAAAVVVFNPTPLAWRDTELTQSFEVQVAYADGSVATVPRAAFEPYDILFAQNRLFRASTDPQIVGTYGSVGTAALADVVDDAEVDTLARLHAEHRFSSEWALGFDALVRSLLSSDRPAGMPFLPSPPHHIQSQGGDTDWRDWGQPITALLRLRMVVRTADSLIVVSDEVVRRIAL